MRLFKLLICTTLISISAQAIEYQFDGGSITALGGITSQPAGLGYLNQKYSFAASATSLEYTKYKVQNNAFEQNNSPMSMKPVFVGSAMSTSYGGWSLLIFNYDDEYRAQYSMNDGTYDTESDVTSRISAFTALVSSGFRIHENWSLGWNLSINQIQTQSSTKTSVTGAALGSFQTSELISQSTSAGLGMGTIYNTEQFALGLYISTPTPMLTSSGKIRRRNLASPSNTYTVETENIKPKSTDNWAIHTGVRIGLTGFSYVLSDTYVTNGQHTLNVGFEYVGSWGTIASGITHSEFKKIQNSNLTVGFIKDHKNFKWGVGPYLREKQNGEAGSLNSRTFGILYSSEIRY